MARYYDENGVVTEVIGSKGKPVKCTLTHARKYGYIPSVTTITGIWTQANLIDWTISECSKIAYNAKNSSSFFYSEDAVKNEFKKQSQDRMDLGTKVHDEIENLLLDSACGATTVEATRSSVLAHDLTLETISDHGAEFICPEKFVFSREDFVAGRIDVLHSKGVLDYKTKKTVPDKPIPKASESYIMQQAAYLVGEYGLDKLSDPETFGGVIWVSTTEPERVELELLDYKKLQWGWDCFETLCKFYRTIKKL